MTMSGSAEFRTIARSITMAHNIAKGVLTRSTRETKPN